PALVPPSPRQQHRAHPRRGRRTRCPLRHDDPAAERRHRRRLPPQVRPLRRAHRRVGHRPRRPRRHRPPGAGAITGSDFLIDCGYDETLHAFDKSARKLGVDQIDLLILHQALPSAFDRTLDAYRALETLLADGKVRAIGVSNFMTDHLATLLDKATVVPAV